MSSIYPSELDLNSSTIIQDALDPVSLAQLNDVLFDFRSISPVQFERLLLGGFESPLRKQSSGPILKLYGSARCCSTARVAVVLHEKRIGYELHPLHSADGDTQPRIDDNGIILYGCRNICQYLATRYGERAKFTEIQSFEPLARNALYETLIKQQQCFLPSDAIGSSALQELSNNMDVYESILSRQKYLAGGEISLVDLYHLPYGEMLCTVGIDLLTTKGQNLSRWWTDISSRSSWLTIKNGVPSKGP
ncbi:hypothetical protein J3R30DRAFT_1219168 [Lentinula aciculospora]|uniref:glutathione transferase n=1 Tax=Lentinula aciculospora TaxID=153920 RepID=A0A9W9A0X6_9AGAR|nr:hypothetical protein J3R30DRAFT_1219168 [Lentinula aciculospora]